MSCSDTFGIGGSDKDSESFEKYLVCPISEEVCGTQREFELKTPDILGSLTYSGAEIPQKKIPPGYVCSYTILLEQTMVDEGAVADQSSSEKGNKVRYQTEMEIYRPHETINLANKYLMGDLFWYARNGDDLDMRLDKEYQLFGNACSQPENSCTEDVHSNRKFYIDESDGQVSQVFVVLVNKASLNDPWESESFSAGLVRLEVDQSSQIYMWISAAWMVICAIAICITSQLAAESDD